MISKGFATSRKKHNETANYDLENDLQEGIPA
jgi:hypothetical protein